MTGSIDQDLRSAPFDLLQWLTPEQRAEFIRRSSVRRVPAGAIIYSQTDEAKEMYRVECGSVRLSVMRSDGRELLYVIFQPGDCFGLSGLVDDEPLPQTAEAGDDCQLQVLSAAEFHEMRRSAKDFEAALLRLATRHMRLLSGLFADAHLQSVSARIASRILSIAAAFGQLGSKGIELNVDLSQSDLAMMVGGARQTVNRILQDFQRAGLLSIEDGRIIVRSSDGLRAVAGAIER